MIGKKKSMSFLSIATNEVRGFYSYDTFFTFKECFDNKKISKFFEIVWVYIFFVNSMVTDTGLEPVTSAMSMQRSRQLS